MNIEKHDIVKATALIEGYYNPGSRNQMRLLTACLMQIKAALSKSDKPNFDHRIPITVTVDGFADLVGTDKKVAYRDLKKAAEDLHDFSVVVHEKPNQEIGAPDETHINVTDACRYHEKEGKVVVRFGYTIAPYISDLSKKFTKYLAKYTLPMKSSYGVRLYEICLSRMGEEWLVTPDEFRKTLGIEKEYPRIDNLKRRVVNPAIKDINTYSDIKVTFGQRKSGRRVIEFQFLIVKPMAKAKALPIRDWIAKNKLAKPGESWDTTIDRLKSKHAKYKKDLINA